MGRPMAMRVAQAGFSLRVADARAESLAPFADLGLATATRPAELAGDVVLTMLPTDTDVADALFGDGGALERAAVIDMSSSAPQGTLDIAARLAKRNVAFLDVPVSGGVPRAKTGELTAMAGGDAAPI